MARFHTTPDGNIPFTAEEEAEWDAREAEDEIQNAEYLKKEYQRQRASEYPSIQEQMDMQYWDAVNGTTNWKDLIASIKDKYPKPTE